MKIRRVRPIISEAETLEILELIGGSLRAGSLTQGPLVARFENEFARYTGVRHAVAVSSGTAALEVTLRSLGIEGGEVIVPSQTFVATANAVLLAGGRPVFAEIKPETFCLDPRDVARRVSGKTRAVILVDMAGLVPPDALELADLCRRHGLALVEDAAHAHGAALNGRKAGALGRAGCFSFYPTKVITTGEGGMITTDDDDLARLARSYRNHGINPYGTDYLRVSANWRLPETAAAIGLVQLRRLDEFVRVRNRIARVYERDLAGTPGLKLLSCPGGILHSYWTYLVLLDEGVGREATARRLGDDFGIETAWPYDPPCHLQPVFRDRLGTRSGDLPVSEGLMRRHLALPMHLGMSEDDAAYVAQSLRAALASTPVRI